MTGAVSFSPKMTGATRPSRDSAASCSTVASMEKCRVNSEDVKELEEQLRKEKEQRLRIQQDSAQSRQKMEAFKMLLATLADRSGVPDDVRKDMQDLLTNNESVARQIEDESCPSAAGRVRRSDSWCSSSSDCSSCDEELDAERNGHGASQATGPDAGAGAPAVAPPAPLTQVWDFPLSNVEKHARLHQLNSMELAFADQELQHVKDKFRRHRRRSQLVCGKLADQGEQPQAEEGGFKDQVQALLTRLQSWQGTAASTDSNPASEEPQCPVLQDLQWWERASFVVQELFSLDEAVPPPTSYQPMLTQS